MRWAAVTRRPARASGVGVQGGEVAVDAQEFGGQIGMPVRAQGLAVGERVAAVGAVKGGAGRDSWSVM